MRKARLIGCAIALGFAVCASALAEEAYTSKSANLRAGPGREYPIVARIPAGSPVEVAGCLEDYAWCDVIAGPDRGWVYSGNLEYPYEGRRVVILNEGPVIGFPIITFSVGPYWDSYYRGRPWYGRRDYWARRPFPPRHRWVRPTGPGFHPRGPRPSIGRRPEPRPHVGTPPVPRSGPRDHGRIRPPRPPQPRPQARPPTRHQPNRPDRPQEERNHGPVRR